METPETNPQNPELVPATSETPAHVPDTPEQVRADEVDVHKFDDDGGAQPAAEGDPHPDQGLDPAPPSVAPVVVPPPAPAENHQPSNDEAQNDSLGFAKEAGLVGPRGANVSPEHLTEIQKAESAEAIDRRAHVGMSSTDHIDSIGNPKGAFETFDRGNDRHGAKRPDFIFQDEPVEQHQPMVGPRGVGAPKDSFHKARK
jgi:hypothetical protein